MRGVLIFICLILSMAFKSQTITVLDKISQSPIELVYIYDDRKSSDFAVYTDTKGQADISMFKNSKVLYFQHSTYERYQLQIDKGLMISLVFLEPIWHSIEGIEVKAKRQSMEEDDIGSTVQIIDAITARLENPQTSADMLAQSGQVLIQKSQMGGGSPIIRGFEANRILLVVDGVRMNNAIYRSGHLQNAITVDPHYLESTEIVFGPSSVLYGSDALGGVIHFHTKQPKFSTKEGEQEVATNAFLRSSSANNEKSGHVDFTIAGKRVGYNLSFSASSFGDLRMGRKRIHGYNDWGIVSHFVNPENDEVIQNTNLALQPRTGYDQVDLGSKLNVQLTDSMLLTFNIQYSNSTDINRWDRLNDFSNGIPAWAEWKYGPQERLFSALTLNVNGDGFYDNAVFTAAYQNVGEDRINRRLGSETRFIREETVDVFSLNLDFSKRLKRKSTLYYGLEYLDNVVESIAHEEDINTGEREVGITRYPNGGSGLKTYAAYTSLSTKWNKTLKSNFGLRYSHTDLEANFENNSFFSLPFNEIAFGNGALTGSLGLEKSIEDKYQFDFLMSTGFKSPNIDDAGKIFEKDGFVVIPNNEVKPEYVFNGEFGVHRFWNKRQSSINFAAFYTRIFDALVRRDADLNGQDSLLYEGELAKIQTNVNVNEAEIYGLSFGLNWEINDWFRWSGTLNYTLGQDISEDIPLAHIPPVFGKSELIFYNESLTGAVYGYYNGWKRPEDFSPGTTDNPAEATIDGFPSWYTLNVRVSRRFSPSFSFNFAMENILDHHYKTFASGLSASGRNLIFSASFNL